MKEISFSSVIAIVTASFVVASFASGQAMAQRSFNLGAYAGASMPLGSFKDQSDAGFHVGAFGATALSPNLRVRFDGAYNDFGTKDFSFTDASASHKASLVFGTLDAEYNIGAEPGMASGVGTLPYISGGVGAYRFAFDDSCSGTGCSDFILGSSSETDWGLNAGVGAIFQLSGFTPFVDAQYHTIFPKAKNGQSGRMNMLLLSFGLRF